MSGDIGGYATDVLESEFSNISDSPIFKLFKSNLYNILVTPHVGGMTFEGQEKAFLYALKNSNFPENETFIGNHSVQNRFETCQA